MEKTPNPYDLNKVLKGYHNTRRQSQEGVPFKLKIGRDNLYERMHGLPKMSKEEMKVEEKRYDKSVDFKAFLPNSLITSP